MLTSNLCHIDRFNVTNFMWYNGVPQEFAFNLHRLVGAFKCSSDEKEVKDKWSLLNSNVPKAIDYTQKYYTWDIYDRTFVFLNGKLRKITGHKSKYTSKSTMAKTVAPPGQGTSKEPDSPIKTDDA